MPVWKVKFQINKRALLKKKKKKSAKGKVTNAIK